MPEFFPLNVKGLSEPRALKVHAQGDQVVSKAIRESGQWEIYETELILSCLKKGQTFLDVGANVGYFSVIAGDKVGADGKVFCFEPEKKNFALLEENIHYAQLLHVTAVNAALAAHEGQGELYLSTDNFGDHQVYKHQADHTEQQFQPIQFVEGDRYLSDIPRVDFIKIDTQGAEFQVITGLEQTIKRSLPSLTMLVEFWPHGLTRSGSGAHQLLDLLLSFALPIAIIDHQKHRLIPCTESDLRPWIDDVDNDSSNEGFMNLLLGEV